MDFLLQKTGASREHLKTLNSSHNALPTLKTQALLFDCRSTYRPTDYLAILLCSALQCGPKQTDTGLNRGSSSPSF